MAGMTNSYGLSGSTHTKLTEGMGGRLKRKGGNLVPLKDRISVYKQAKREVKIQARRTVAAQLLGQQTMFFGRGFWGKVKFIAVGR